MLPTQATAASVTIHSLPLNPFRAALGQGRPLVGIWSMLNSSNAVEGMGDAGFDWILIDGEHSLVSMQDMVSHLRALKGASAVPIVRLVGNDPLLLKHALDAGATTIMLPYIQNAAEAKAAVMAMQYAPRGNRGAAAMHRASHFARIPDYMQRAHESLYLIVQIESLEAIEQLEAIAAIDGVDALFFGPGDLAATMGMPGQAGHPDVTALIQSCLARVRKTGKAAGVLAPNDAISESHLKAGFDFVSVANDCAILFKGADAIAARFRALAG